jgi:hypothetical protein
MEIGLDAFGSLLLNKEKEQKRRLTGAPWRTIMETVQISVSI